MPTILVIEDDRDSREMLCTWLQQHGYRTLAAAEGGDALRQMDETSELALILLDLMMPGMNGFDFLQALRQRPLHRTLPVFVWTAMQLGPQDLSALEQSARAVIGKVDGGLDVLVRQLRAWQAARAAMAAQ